MNVIHYLDWVCSGFRFGSDGTYVRRDVTCGPCLAAVRDADEDLAYEWHRKVLLAEQPASRDERYVRRMTAHLLRYGGMSFAAKDAVIAQDWDEALAEDRLRRRIDQASKIENRAAAEAAEWSTLLADATAVRRRLSAQLRLIQGAGGTPRPVAPAAPVNAVQDTSAAREALWTGFAPGVWPNKQERPESPVVANPHARHDMFWSPTGTGLCFSSVSRPDGRVEACGEPANSPVHG